MLFSLNFVYHVALGESFMYMHDGDLNHQELVQVQVQVQERVSNIYNVHFPL